MLSTRGYEGMIQPSHRDLLNPIGSNLLFQGGIGDVFGVMDKVQSHDDETQGSGSGVSDLSALENDTDDFGRRLLQHHRDEQRLSNARGNGQPFRKARPKPRVAESILREERERESKEDQQRLGSSDSNDSDPPVTIPREWGRKARRQRDWMKKIIEPSEVDESEHIHDAKPEEDAIYPHRTAYTGDIDWQDSTLDPNTPPSMRRQRHSAAATPSSMRHMNTTLRPSASSEDGDFTAASLLASTPAATRLPRKIDELTRREIEDIERQGLTTRALDEMDQRSPNGTLRRTSSTRLRERAIADGMAGSPPRLSRQLTLPADTASPSKIPRRRRSPIGGNKENVPINGDVNGHDDTKQAGATKIPTLADPAANVQNSPRTRHHRNDSMNLLRKLARVSSMSPSPAREKADVDDVQKKDTSAPRTDAAPSSTKAAGGSEVTKAKPSRNERKSSGWGLEFDALAGSRGDDENGNGEAAKEQKEAPVSGTDKTPAPKDQPANGTTPVVTGAWVDSSLPNGASSAAQTKNAVQQPGAVSSDKATVTGDANGPNDDLRRVRSDPPRPKSALEAIMQETRNQENDLQFGESTIQSLEDIVHPNFDLTDPTITFEYDTAAAVQESIDTGEELTQAQKDRRQEDLALEGLNKHLRTARTSIKDANRGLRRVENKIDAAQEVLQPAPTPKTTTTIIVRKPADANGYTHCDVCGGGYHSVWYALWAEFRSLFYSWDPSARFGITFTWLGAWCLCWTIWYLIECTLCAYYCKPEYAVPGTKFPPSGYDTPRFPFTIPMVLFKPWQKYWGPTLYALEDAVEAYLHELTMEIPLDSPPPIQPSLRKTFARTVPVRSEWVAAATATSVRVAQSVMDAVDEVGSMWDDEFLV